jgi:Flp pilus assembly protein TadG
MQIYRLMRRRLPGQSMVEFALILPLLVAFLFGIVELGILLNVYIGITNMAREGARAGSVYQYTGTPPKNTDVGGVPIPVDTQAAPIDQQRLLYISSILTDTMNPIVSPSTLTVTVTYPTTPTTDPYRAGDTLNVTLQHNEPLFFGLLGPKNITLRATSAMRIEPGANK